MTLYQAGHVPPPRRARPVRRLAAFRHHHHGEPARSRRANPETPGLAGLVDELTKHSPEFARLWQRYDIRRRRSEPKTFRHPQVGTSDGQRMSVYQAAPGSTDQDALKLLALLAAELPAQPAQPR